MPANQRYSSVKNVCENLTLQEIVHVGIHDDQSFNGSCTGTHVNVKVPKLFAKNQLIKS